jgi:hypothetical protein
VLAIAALLGLASVQSAQAQAAQEEEAAPADKATPQPVYEAPELEEEKPVSQVASLAPLYVPPELGIPGGRVGAGTRGSGRQSSLQLLAPDHPGLTHAAQPTLYWYLAKATTTRIDVTIQDPDSVEPLLEVQLPLPVAAGVHRIQLADHGVRLQPEKSYQWFVSLVPDPQRRSSDFVAGAWIRLDPTTEGLRATPDARKVVVYAENGIWYDAIASVSEQIDAAPRDAALRVQRAALLEQVGLSEVADYDRAQTDGR